MSRSLSLIIQINLSIIYLIIFFNGVNNTNLLEKFKIKTFNESLRLPNHTIPLTYNLSFIIDDKNLEVHGLANIEIQIQNTTNEIILNSKNLKNFKINIINLKTGENIPNIFHNFNNETNFLKIYSNQSDFMFENDSNLMLTIKYRANINDNSPHGIYKATDDDDNKKYVIVTQFEPSFARQAFPCFDEPTFKARFIVTLTHSKTYTALSNMPITGEPLTSSDGLQKITKFQQTPLMSTYLLAFTLQNYINVSAEMNNITQTIYFSDPEDKLKAEYTLKKVVETLNLMEEFFGISYPLPKLDHITVPISLGNAMENWGLITYGKNKFLLNSNCSSSSDFQNIITMTHEMVHQWFGNLLSPKWWTYTWLNEGFATYYSYIIADLVFPECQIKHLRIIDSLNFGFHWPVQRPLSKYVEHEEEIKNVFDLISYHRGAFVIRMIQHTLGTSTFQKGIYNYLQNYQYSNVDEDNLFHSLEIAAQQDNITFFNENGFVSKFFKTWTHNSGYPNLYVKRDYSNGDLILTQSPHTFNYTAEWYIPITFITPTNSNFDDTKYDYIMPPVKTITINIKNLNLQLQPDDWLILNKKQIGFYHINYDNNNWLLIANQLHKNHSQIDVANRVQIIRDITLLIKTNKIEIITALELISYMKNEENFLPWIEVHFIFSQLTTRLNGTETGELFKYFLRDLIKSIYDKIKFDTIDNIDLPLTEIVRSSIIELACEVNLEECLQDSYKKFIEYMESGDYEKCFSDTNVICSGVRYASELEFKKTLNIILLKNDTDNLPTYLEPLLCSNNLNNLKLLLESVLEKFLTLDETNLNSLFIIAQSIYMSNDLAQTLVFDFFLEHIDDLIIDTENLTKILETMVMYMSENDEQLAKYNLIAEKINIQITDEIMESQLFHIGIIAKGRKEFISKHLSILNMWLTSYKIKIEQTNSID